VRFRPPRGLTRAEQLQQDCARLFIKKSTGRGQRDPASGSIKQTRAELFFQCIHVPGERRLGETQLIRRPGKRELLCHRHEAFQFAQRIIHTEKVS